jgi:threonine dehydratase
MFALSQLESAAELVYSVMPPTPQICWPLLSARCGCEVWVKHENHTPISSFKLRGGLVYVDALERTEPGVTGLVAETSGNHGQSLAFAGRRAGLSVLLVVPRGTHPERLAMLRVRGAEVVEHGRDSDEAIEFADELATARGLHPVPSFHPWIVCGVATLGLELLRAVPDLDTLYVPIGIGSEICGVIAARQALGLGTEIVGVVPEGAPTYALSFAAGESRPTGAVDTIAGGLAMRNPDPAALEIILAHAARVISVSDAEIGAAIRHFHTDTHNLVEPSGAVTLAGLLRDCHAMAGKRVGLVASGGNIDADLYVKILGRT